MSDACHQPEFGQLIHAFELGLLSESERAQFELHVLECDACLEQLRGFGPEARALRLSPELRTILKPSREPESADTAPKRRWRQFLWPSRTPVPLRPAFLLLACAVLLVPAWRGLNPGPNGGIEAVQELGLVVDRSGNAHRGTVVPGQPLVLAFVCPESDATRGHTLVLEEASGAELFRDPDFRDFDRFSTGRLLLPASVARPGAYTLRITRQASTGGDPVHFVFPFILE